MTTHTLDPTTSSTTTSDAGAPARRTLLGLASAFLVLFAIGVATSKDPQDYDKPATVMKDFDLSRPMLMFLLALGIFAGTVLVWYGAALKRTLEQRTGSWTTTVVGQAFTLGGVTMLLLSLPTIWLYHAVDIGDASAVQALTIIDVGIFPAMMLLFVTAYVSVGIAAYAGRSLPTWLCALSVLLGVIAPISVGGYASFVAFPFWLLAVAAMVRREPHAS